MISDTELGCDDNVDNEGECKERYEKTKLRFAAKYFKNETHKRIISGWSESVSCSSIMTRAMASVSY